MDEKDIKAPENIEEYQSNYSESGFWSVLKKVGAKVLKPALQLYYVLQKDGLDFNKKAAIIGALGYLILPVDLIPDAIPFAGFTDDFAALMAVLKMVSGEIDGNVNKQVAERTHAILGEGEIEEAEKA